MSIYGTEINPANMQWVDVKTFQTYGSLKKDISNDNAEIPKDLSRNFDRLELSENADELMAAWEASAEEAKKNLEDDIFIDVSDNPWWGKGISVEDAIRALWDNKSVNFDNIATSYASFAWQYDKWYADGRINKEEYDGINNDLKKQFEEAMARLDKVRAAVDRRNQENKMKPKEWREYTKYMNSLSNEERVALVKEEMDGFIERFGLDRRYMFNLLETMRHAEPKDNVKNNK